MEYTIYLFFIAVFGMPALSSSSWVGEGYHHFQEAPIIQPHHPHLYTPAPAHNLLEQPAHLVSYQGPIAVPVVLPSGHLADTPEIFHAKQHHLSAVAQAKADQYYKGHSEQGYGGAYGYSGSYHGHGVPVVLPNGHLADTHEVAAAKSAHLLAVSKTKADKYYSGHGQGYGYGDHEYGYSGSYHGYGIPVVLPSGHLADTHEVAAAKSAHLLAVAKTKADKYYSGHGQGYGYGDHEYGYSGSYHGYGIPVVLPSGHLADTHEVAAAKTAHLLAVAHAQEQQAYYYYDDDSRHYDHYQEPNHYHYPLYVHYNDGGESLHGLQYLNYHE